MANIENLRVLTSEEAREIGRKGGIASGEARREKATMKKTLEMLLETVPDIKGNEEGLTYKQLATIGLLKGAIDGKAENYKAVVQLLGELKEESSNETPTVQINIVDNSELEKTLYEDSD